MRNEICEDISSAIAPFYGEKKGDIITRVTSDIQEIEISIVQFLEIIFREPIMILTYLGGCFMSPQLTLLFLLYFH